MSNPPSWLPAVISVDGNFQDVVQTLYGIFASEFIDKRPDFLDMPVWYDRTRKGSDPYEEGFWHLITRDSPGKETRLFDPRRAERLPWCSPVICHGSHAAVKAWDYDDGRRIRTYVWLEQFDYVVLLEKRVLKQKAAVSGVLPERTIAFLITAYHVDGESVRRSLRKKYEGRVQ